MNGEEKKERKTEELVKKSEDWDRKANEFLSKKKSKNPGLFESVAIEGIQRVNENAGVILERTDTIQRAVEKIGSTTTYIRAILAILTTFIIGAGLYFLAA